MEKETRQIWLRLGCNVTASEEDIEKVLKGDKETLYRLIESGAFNIDGNTYIPDTEIETYNDTYGENHRVEEIGFDF